MICHYHLPMVLSYPCRINFFPSSPALLSQTPCLVCNWWRAEIKRREPEEKITLAFLNIKYVSLEREIQGEKSIDRLFMLVLSFEHPICYILIELRRWFMPLSTCWLWLHISTKVYEVAPRNFNCWIKHITGLIVRRYWPHIVVSKYLLE